MLELYIFDFMSYIKTYLLTKYFVYYVIHDYLLNNFVYYVYCFYHEGILIIVNIFCCGSYINHVS